MNKKKSLFKNSIYNVVYKLLDALLPLLSAAYVARVLLDTGVGKVSYAQNIAQYFVLVASLGIPSYGIREIAKNKRDTGKTGKVFSELFLINLASTLLCSAAYYAMVLNLSYFAEKRNLSLAAGMLIIFNIFNVDWFYQGQEEFGYIAIRSFIVKLISLACLFLIIKTPSDYVKYMLLTVLTTGGNYVVNMVQLRKFGIRLQWKNLDLPVHMKPVLILLGTTVAIELYTMLDTTMIGMMCSDKNVGYYTNSMKLVKIVITVITAIGGVLLPHLSQYRAEGNNEACSRIVNKVFQVMFFLFLPCCFGMLFIADPLILLLFGESFAPAGTTLKIASFLILALGFSNLFGTQVLLSYGAEKKLLLCTVAGALSNICMNLFLIPAFAQNGAAVASVISEALVTLLCVIYSMKYITIKMDFRFMIKTIIATAAMCVFVYFIMGWAGNIFVKMAAAITGGVIVYFGANLLLHNPMLLELKSILKKN